jgi:myo-inositol 2-dehydrogenase/D-chiro-inositol 1-dehydrogenase
MSLKICVVGCGNWSRSQHGPSYARYAATHPDTELAACCDIDEERAIRYRDQFGFARHCTDYVAMLEAEKPDAVCLLMRGGEPTCELACRILEMGYPLITEKPPGDTTEQIDAMIAAAEASGAPNQVAFNRRYMGLMRELKRISDGLKPSDIQHVRYDLVRVGRRDLDFSTTAIHGIDTARHLAESDYARIRFQYRELPDLGPGVANILMACTFESGATGHLNFLPVTGMLVERGTVYAHDHTFVLHVPQSPGGVDFPGRVQHFEKGELKMERAGPDVSGGDEHFVLNGVYGENESFFEDIRNGRRPEYDLKTARQSVEVAQCVRERRTEYQAP